MPDDVGAQDPSLRCPVEPATRLVLLRRRRLRSVSAAQYKILRSLLRGPGCFLEPLRMTVVVGRRSLNRAYCVVSLLGMADDTRLCLKYDGPGGNIVAGL